MCTNTRNHHQSTVIQVFKGRCNKHDVATRNFTTHLRDQTELVNTPRTIGWKLWCIANNNNYLINSPKHYIDAQRFIIFLKILICVYLKKVSHTHQRWHECEQIM